MTTVKMADVIDMAQNKVNLPNLPIAQRYGA